MPSDTMNEKTRKRLKLPKHCECGGRMEYQVSFNRIWSACAKCTPVVKISLDNIKVRGNADAK